MYVRNCWYVASWSDEVDGDTLISRVILDQPILLYRAEDGGVVGLADRCCHRSAPLSKGRREGNDIRCMYHGLRFNREGTCVDIPGQDAIPKKARVRSFPVVERYGWVWVWMGDPASADDTLIPPVFGLDDPKYTLRPGQMSYKANYQLINDNLTDFSHFSYVHETSFRTGDVWSRDHSTLTRVPRGVHVERWVEGERWSIDDEPASDGETEFDNWMSYDFLVPGILTMINAQYPTGTAKRCDFGPPPSDISPFSANYSSQAVTPVTDKTSHYFFSWGPDAGEGSEEVADQMSELLLTAFREDREMIEAQQQVLDREPKAPQVFIVHDKGPALMRQVIKDLSQSEMHLIEA